MEKTSKDSFIVAFWRNIFAFLSLISIFYWVRKVRILENHKHAFVDIWVLTNLASSIVILIAIRLFNIPLWIELIVLGYSFLRVFEIIIYQVNLLLFDNKSKDYSVKSYKRSVILLLHNYLEVILWFAISYTILSITLQIDFENNSNHDSFLLSFQTMVSLGADQIISLQNIGQFIMFFQVITGLFLTTISLAYFISFLPKPSSQDPVENEIN